ncbi:MAG: hypothetical protein MZW92_65900 [Comamonadaceae bacterium]|nr:hypothetical protein [Comamonadaceae bacterium]
MLHTQAVGKSSLAFGRFGTVAVHAPAGPPRQVVLFVSDDGGWNPGVIDHGAPPVRAGGGGSASTSRTTCACWMPQPSPAPTRLRTSRP